jgi:integrase
MASLRKMTYTKPIPEGAERITRKGKPAVRFVNGRGKVVVARLNADGTRIVEKSRKWYGVLASEGGGKQYVPLSADKAAAEVLLGELVRKRERGRADLPDEDQARRPLSLHLQDWQASLAAGGTKPKRIRAAVNCARRVIEGCGFRTLRDLAAGPVEQFLARLRTGDGPAPDPEQGKESWTRAELAALLGVGLNAVTELVRRHRLPAAGNGRNRRYPPATALALLALRSRGVSVKTSNEHLAAVKQFCSWLVEEERLDRNPLGRLKGGNVKADRRHDRRTLPAEDLKAILAAAQASDRTFRGLSGPDRAALYATACGTGFRVQELASLTPALFSLDDTPPTVALAAKTDKAGRPVLQPIAPELADSMRNFLAGKDPALPLWPGKWYERAADMLRIDLDAAGIPYEVEGPDGLLYADFHALRHSFIALLDKAGVTLKEAMQLARHSDPKLTMAVYGRARLHDLGAAAARLPSLKAFPSAFPAAEAACGRMREDEEEGAEEGRKPARTQPPDSQGLEAG